jgi:tripartite-type tricarboxylate transporter receptor subunit TctC
MIKIAAARRVGKIASRCLSEWATACEAILPTRTLVARLPTLLLLAMTTAIPSHAQTPWPQKTVKLILPLGAGSATDVTARLFAERLSERWNKPVIVENRAGPDGIVAVMAFVGAHDEHTLLFSIGGPVTINPVSHAKLDYDPDRDLVPIAPAADSFIAVAVNPSLGVSSIDELIRRAKAEPGKLSWAATPGLPQFVFAGFAKSAGLDMVQVSYRNFSPALQDLAENRIQLVATGLLPLLPFARDGRIKLLVVTNRERSPAAPELATAREIGHPELAADGFQGFFGWRGMPESLRERIAADVRAVGADQAMAQKLAVLGQAIRTGTPAEFAAMIAEQRAKIAGIAQAIDLQKQ